MSRFESIAPRHQFVRSITNVARLVLVLSLLTMPMLNGCFGYILTLDGCPTEAVTVGDPVTLILSHQPDNGYVRVQVSVTAGATLDNPEPLTYVVTTEQAGSFTVHIDSYQIFGQAEFGDQLECAFEAVTP